MQANQIIYLHPPAPEELAPKVDVDGDESRVETRCETVTAILKERGIPTAPDLKNEVQEGPR